MPQEHGVSGAWVLARAALGTCPEWEEEAEREAEEPGLEAASPGEFSWRELPGPPGWLVGGGWCLSGFFSAGRALALVHYSWLQGGHADDQRGAWGCGTGALDQLACHKGPSPWAETQQG